MQFEEQGLRGSARKEAGGHGAGVQGAVRAGEGHSPWLWGHRRAGPACTPKSAGRNLQDTVTDLVKGTR